MFSDSRWGYTYVVSASLPDGGAALPAPYARRCSQPICQIGQRALISGSLKDSASCSLSCRQVYSASDTPDSVFL